MVVVNNIPPQRASNDGMGFFLGVILLIIFVVLIVYYAGPAIRGGFGGGAPQINVPGKIDVNVNKK